MGLNNVILKVKKLHPDAKIPMQGSPNSAGFDLYSIEDYELLPGETHAFGTGLPLKFLKVRRVLSGTEVVWDLKEFTGLRDYWTLIIAENIR
jgi:hypothetical protein